MSLTEAEHTDATRTKTMGVTTQDRIKRVENGRYEQTVLGTTNTPHCVYMGTLLIACFVSQLESNIFLKARKEHYISTGE